MKNVIKQTKKGLAALLAVVMVMGVAPLVPVMAEGSEGYLMSRIYLISTDEDILLVRLSVAPEGVDENDRLQGNNNTSPYVIPVGTAMDVSIYGATGYTYAVSVYEGELDEYNNFSNTLFSKGKQPGRSNIPEKATHIFDTAGDFVVGVGSYASGDGGEENFYFSVIESAQTTTTTPTNDTISVTINGTAVNFTDQQPANIGGRVLVPVRGVFETLGFDVSWNGDLRQATLARANDTIVITIDSATFTTNGVSHTLDVPAQSIGDRTMIPLRAVLESVGYKLDWDGDTQTVIISTN